MEARAVLVEVEHATGSSGVVIDGDGDVWLTLSLERVGGSRLDDYLPNHAGLDGERTLLGGRLPAGAVAVEVLDDRGDRVQARAGRGAWAVVLDQPMSGPVSPVCLRDADGVPVAAPLPSDWERSPVVDSDDRCPACLELAWDVVTPADESRGSRSGAGGMEPTPVIVCRVCGHEESMGSIQRLVQRDDEDPEDVAARIRDSQAAQRISDTMTLRAVRFPIYAAEGWSGTLGGSGGGSGNVERITVSHGHDQPGSGAQLRIETAVNVPRFPSSASALAREALANWLYDGLGGWAPGSDAAFVLKLRAHERKRRRIGARAPVTERLIRLDGVRVSFKYIQSGSRWAAVARTDPVTITITGDQVDPASLELRPVPDPIEFLL